MAAVITRRFLVSVACSLLSLSAWGQSTPNWSFGYVPPPQEWNNLWAEKADVNNGTLTSPTINGGNASLSNSTATGSTTARSLASRATDLGVNILDFAGTNTQIGQAKVYNDGTITAGTNVFCSNKATFTASDVHKLIQIDGAGTGATAAPLNTTIASTGTLPHCVNLTANAGTTTPLSYFASATVATAGASGSYIPGETVTLTGGTQSVQAVANIQDTKVHSGTVTAGGSGGTNGTCVVQTTTGTGTPAQISTTIAGGAITAIGSITVAGHFFTDLTNKAAEPVTNISGGTCAPTGATLNLVMWAETVNVNTKGSYSVVPSNPVATGAGSSSGATGLTLTVTWDATGAYIYGADDSLALNAAATQAQALFTTTGINYNVFIPAGNYLIDGTPIPLMTNGVVFKGVGHSLTNLHIGASYSGDLFSFSEAWIDGTAGNYGLAPFAAYKTGAGVVGLSIFADRLAAARQNAIEFYDRDDEINIDDVQVYNVNGNCLASGIAKNTSSGFIRESHKFGRFTCWNSGSAGVPAVLFDSQGPNIATNEIYIGEIDIYGPYGPGFVIRDNAVNGIGDIKIDNLRIEGTERNDNNVQADLMMIGDPAETGGSASNIFINNLMLIDGYAGHAALRFTAPSVGSQPFYVRIFDGFIGGGTSYSQGIAVDFGRDLYVNIAGIATWGTNFTTGASSGANLYIDNPSAQSGWTFNLSGTPGNVKFPSTTACATSTC